MPVKPSVTTTSTVPLEIALEVIDIDSSLVTLQWDSTAGPFDILGDADLEQDPAMWDQSMRINLDGPFHLSRLLLTGMVERRYGRLVYTSSTAGVVPEPAGSAYNSSKHGLIGLMRSVSIVSISGSSASCPAFSRTFRASLRSASATD